MSVIVLNLEDNWTAFALTTNLELRVYLGNG